MATEFFRRFWPNNRSMLAKAEYMQIVAKVKVYNAAASAGRPVLEGDTWSVLHRYDVAVVLGEERLVAPAAVAWANSQVKVYAYAEELFDVIDGCHVANGHCDRRELHRLLKLRYHNIAVDVVALYVELCATCAARDWPRRAVRGDPEPDAATATAKRCQLDLMSMESRPDGPFTHYMVYRDMDTGFVYLQAQSSDSTRDITYTMIDLFSTMGAPAVLQSENGRGVAEQIVNDVRTLWPSLRLVHGHAPPPPVDGRSVNGDIQDMIDEWLLTNKTGNWCMGIKFVQSAYNKLVPPGMSCSPYELVYGSEVRDGLILPQLTDDVTASLKYEEEVYMALDQYDKNKYKNGKPTVTIVKQENDAGPSTSSAVTTARVSTEGMIGKNVKVKLTGTGQGLSGIRDTRGIILSIKGDMYEIGTDLGRLQKRCTRDQFEICDPMAPSMSFDDFPLDEICTHEVTQFYSLNTLVCRCLKKCKNYRCICKKMQMLCKSTCHNQSPCFNKNIDDVTMLHGLSSAEAGQPME